MKIALYSPYLDTAGGGEKYMLCIGECLSKNGYEVDFLIGTHLQNRDISGVVNKIKNLHNLDLSNVNFVNAPIGKGSSFFERIFFLIKYSLFIYLTDGSIFIPTAKKNLIHFQTPFKYQNNLWKSFKMSFWNGAIYNSYFTKNIIEQSWPINGQVIYPPVDTSVFKMLPKKKLIVSVGRFFGYLKDKKQLILINAFKKLVDENKIKEWSLNLAGGMGSGDEEYVNYLKKEAKGYRINFYPNLPFDDLVRLYEESSIYWHAAGFNEEDPVKMEHFGITTVEAMAGGCIPVVINKGGQVEIVEDEDFLWETIDDLKSKTLELINNPKKMEYFANKARKRAQDFSKEKFIKEILRLV